MKYQALRLANHGYKQEQTSKGCDKQWESEDRMIMGALQIILVTQLEHATTFTSD